WDDMEISSGAEKLGYPTQKPEALLKRIVRASSNEGDVALDSFCGCGTTVQVAQRLKRRWIGIDTTQLAIGLVRKRLADSFGEEIRESYRFIGRQPQSPGFAHSTTFKSISKDGAAAHRPALSLSTNPGD